MQAQPGRQMACCIQNHQWKGQLWHVKGPGVLVHLRPWAPAVDSDEVSCTDQLHFDEVLGRGAVDDRHERVRLCRAEADRQSVDVRIRPLGVVERELD